MHLCAKIKTGLYLNMRPKKTRWIECSPAERCFIPQCKFTKLSKQVIIDTDEYEVLRLTHINKYSQDEIAKQMKVHRSTISRILSSAHYKVTDAIVNIKIIKVQKECCQVNVIEDSENNLFHKEN
jgi:uncharacterized protein